MADLFYSFVDRNMVPHFAGLHYRNANQQSEVSVVQCIIQSRRENEIFSVLIAVQMSYL